MTHPLMLLKPETNKNPVSTLRTVVPDTTISPAAMGGNIIRIVEDYGQIEVDELSSEITGLKTRLRRAELKKEYVQKLRAISEEYRTAVAKLEQA